MRANFIPALFLACLCFVIFRAAYLRCAKVASRWVIGLLAAALAVPAVLFASNYILLVPFADWFIELHALPGAEISAGLATGLLGVMFASARLRPDSLNRPILIVCSLLALGLVIAPLAKQLFYSVDYYDTLVDHQQDGVCIQSGGHTCVPACCATVVRLLGGKASEPQLARAMGCTVDGCEIWYIKRALRKLGYEPRFPHLKSVRKAPVNSIVGVKVGPNGHVVVVMAKDSKGLTVGEPLSGRKDYTYAKFNKRYRPGGFCIVIERKH